MQPDPPPTIVLFDVDDTLVTTGGAGRRALTRALVSQFGTEDWLAFPLGGMTDRSIVRSTLTRAGRRVDAGTIEDVIEAYLPLLEEELARSEGYRVLPGLPGLLLALARHDHVGLGLGTGNVERGARIKLERGDLNRHFAFGGFGSDHEDRAELLRAGTGRGAAALGRSVGDCRVVVLGDTPRDVAAARAIGARSVAVATGCHSASALEGCGADAVLADLAAPEALRLVLGRAPQSG